MLTTLAIAGLLAYAPGNAPPPDDPVAEFVAWAEAKGYDLISPVCSAASVCYSTVPPGDVVIVWVGGEEGRTYVPDDGAMSASDDVFDVLNPVDVNLFFIGEGDRVCEDFLAARQFGSSIGLEDAMGEIAYGFLIWEFETVWSEQFGGEHRTTDAARETYRQRLDDCAATMTNTTPSTTERPSPPPPTTAPPQLVVVPLDGMHIEMLGRYATVFDDCANVECTISGAATEMGAVLPDGWWFTAGYMGADGVLYVTATDGTSTQTWGITFIFDPQQWRLGGG